MKATRIVGVDRVAEAAKALQEGKLVVFPTETVYGLGADALNPEAVRGIFTAKGRPSDNPLIVHIAKGSQLDGLVREIPDSARELMEAFWPGPLTLVMKKSERIPSIITAGLDTVAIRMPSHPVAMALLEQSGVPVAAPSANLSGSPSPTSEAHVITDLDGRVDMILLGGRTAVGLESTVLDVTVVPARILRPGFITREDLLDVLDEVEYDPHLLGESETPRSPGMKYKHYSPEAQVIIVEGDDPTRLMQAVKRRLESNGEKVGVVCKSVYLEAFTGETFDLGDTDAEMASRLFDALREMDKRGVDLILTHAVKKEKLGVAIMNRLEKAAGHYIIRTGEE